MNVDHQNGPTSRQTSDAARPLREQQHHEGIDGSDAEEQRENSRASIFRRLSIVSVGASVSDDEVTSVHLKSLEEETVEAEETEALCADTAAEVDAATADRESAPPSCIQPIPKSSSPAMALCNNEGGASADVDDDVDPRAGQQQKQGCSTMMEFLVAASSFRNNSTATTPSRRLQVDGGHGAWRGGPPPATLAALAAAAPSSSLPRGGSACSLCDAPLVFLCDTSLSTSSDGGIATVVSAASSPPDGEDGPSPAVGGRWASSGAAPRTIVYVPPSSASPCAVPPPPPAVGGGRRHSGGSPFFRSPSTDGTQQQQALVEAAMLGGDGLIQCSDPSEVKRRSRDHLARLRLKFQQQRLQQRKDEESISMEAQAEEEASSYNHPRCPPLLEEHNDSYEQEATASYLVCGDGGGGSSVVSATADDRSAATTDAAPCVMAVSPQSLGPEPAVTQADRSLKHVAGNHASAPTLHGNHRIGYKQGDADPYADSDGDEPSPHTILLDSFPTCATVLQPSPPPPPVPPCSTTAATPPTLLPATTTTTTTEHYPCSPPKPMHQPSPRIVMVGPQLQQQQLTLDVPPLLVSNSSGARFPPPLAQLSGGFGGTGTATPRTTTSSSARTPLGFNRPHCGSSFGGSCMSSLGDDDRNGGGIQPPTSASPYHSFGTASLEGDPSLAVTHPTPPFSLGGRLTGGSGNGGGNLLLSPQRPRTVSHQLPSAQLPNFRRLHSSDFVEATASAPSFPPATKTTTNVPSTTSVPTPSHPADLLPSSSLQASDMSNSNSSQRVAANSIAASFSSPPRGGGGSDAHHQHTSLRSSSIDVSLAMVKFFRVGIDEDDESFCTVAEASLTPCTTVGGGAAGRQQGAATTATTTTTVGSAIHVTSGSGSAPPSSSSSGMLLSAATATTKATQDGRGNAAAMLAATTSGGGEGTGSGPSYDRRPSTPSSGGVGMGRRRSSTATNNSDNNNNGSGTGGSAGLDATTTSSSRSVIGTTTAMATFDDARGDDGVNGGAFTHAPLRFDFVVKATNVTATATAAATTVAMSTTEDDVSKSRVGKPSPSDCYTASSRESFLINEGTTALLPDVGTVVETRGAAAGRGGGMVGGSSDSNRKNTAVMVPSTATTATASPLSSSDNISMELYSDWCRQQHQLQGGVGQRRN